MSMLDTKVILTEFGQGIFNKIVKPNTSDRKAMAEMARAKVTDSTVDNATRLPTSKMRQEVYLFYMHN